MRTRTVLAMALLPSLLACVILATKWHLAERRANETARWTRLVLDSLGTTVTLPRPPVEPRGRDTVYWQWVATTAQLQSRRWQLAVQHWARSKGTMLDEVDLEVLKTSGLADPATQLRESLEARPDLIPYNGTLGGTMRFSDIILLNRSLVFAEFEDGHIGGSMLLEYSITSPGRVSWKRLWARLD